MQYYPIPVLPFASLKFASAFLLRSRKQSFSCVRACIGCARERACVCERERERASERERERDRERQRQRAREIVARRSTTKYRS